MNETIDPTPEQNNTPLPLPNEAAASSSNVDRVLWYTIGGIVLISCCGLILLGYLFSQTSQFKQLTTFPSIDYTPAPTADIRATENAWVKPARQPTLGSFAEAAAAVKAQNIYPVETGTDYYPTMPDINQPGDLYPFAITMTGSEKRMWSYGWCTLTTRLLDANFDQMKVEFLLNGVPVSSDNIASADSQADTDRYCRTLSVLVKEWPTGTHLLRTNVTFLRPTDDGWNVYPAGTHSFLYYVTVK